MVPTKPRNLSVLEITSTTIRISWLEPEKRNGVIHGYRVYYVYQNQTLLHLPILKNDASLNSVFYYTLANLKPFTDYRIIVTAFTLKYDGEPSEVSLRTDVGGPSPPKVLNLTCHSLDALVFSWQIPRVYHSSIDFYIVNYRNLEYDVTHEIRITANTSFFETSMVIPNLTTNSAYEVKVRGATVSTVNPKKVVLGTYCEPIKITLRENCEQYQPPKLRHNPYVDQELVILAGTVIGCFGLLLIILAIVLWR
uniref:Fibronectin type-III domain-containing protein n=1 Tax=Anopheles epiroticus TaxID=199890 RepID=A0A182PA14_9DIPT